MRAFLTVTGVRSDPTEAVVLDFDEFVPLQFRSSEESIGAGYLQLGNNSTTLIEIEVELYSQVVRGFTVICYSRLSPWPSCSVNVTAEGLPALSTAFDGWAVVELEEDFSVSVRKGEIMFFWGDIGSCEACAFDRLRFLIRDGMLLGIWFLDLTETEIENF